MKDINKFIKLMNLSESSNDAEALNAVRKANKMLRDNKTDWSTLITQKIVINNIVNPTNTEKVTYTSVRKEEPILDLILRQLARTVGRAVGKAFK